MQRTRSGFTLIELMMVVAIIALLVAIAFPLFTDQIDQTRRTDAMTGLNNTAQRLERCYTLENDYTACDLDEGDTFDSPEGHFEIEVTGLESQTFLLTATTQGVQARDEDCRSYTLDQAGRRTAATAGGDDNTEDCW